MKYRPLMFSGLIVLLFGFSAYRSVDEDKGQMILRLMMQGLKDNHYTSQPINDAMSEKVYDLYLERVDAGKRFFTQEDIEKLAPYRQKLDDEINAADYEFFKLADEIYNRRLLQIQTFYQEILAQPFDFTQDESIPAKAEDMAYAKDKEELREYWRKALKYNTLIKLEELINEQDTLMAKSDTVKEKSLAVLEADARAKVLKQQDNWFKRMQKLNEEDHRAWYLNAITGIYDPHTSYFPPDDKETFDIQMSGKFEGIGATLQEKDGYIKITALTPGGPAYRQGQLKENDLILKVAQGADEPVDIVDMAVNDAVKLIRGKKGTEVRLTVKRPDGSIVVIPITRDVVLIEETYARSAIISDAKGSRKFGYIHLPKFYADFNDRSRHCSEDVKKEIIKLKDEGVEGIMIDLRNNGGGSLQDVVDMTGFFIETGPIVQVKGRQGAPYTLTDKDQNVLYNGPLVVMVNHGSASASEILAAAVQDYKRGVIIGSTSTYGKGTVQRFFNLDDYVQGSNDSKPLGSVKLTTQKFYRINGGATQLKGVIPDIIVPDLYNYIPVGEKEEENHMVWDEIAPSTYTMWNNPSKVSKLSSASEKRVSKNPTFQLIEDAAKRLKARDEEKELPLNLEKHRELQKKLKAENEKLDKALKQEIKEMKIEQLKVDAKAIASDTLKQSLHKKWRTDLSKDPYIYESMNVIGEMK